MHVASRIKPEALSRNADKHATLVAAVLVVCCRFVLFVLVVRALALIPTLVAELGSTTG